MRRYQISFALYAIILATAALATGLSPGLARPVTTAGPMPPHIIQGALDFFVQPVEQTTRFQSMKILARYWIAEGKPESAKRLYQGYSARILEYDEYCQGHLGQLEELRSLQFDLDHQGLMDESAAIDVLYSQCVGKLDLSRDHARDMIMLAFHLVNRGRKAEALTWLALLENHYWPETQSDRDKLGGPNWFLYDVMRTRKFLGMTVDTAQIRDLVKTFNDHDAADHKRYQAKFDDEEISTYQPQWPRKPRHFGRELKHLDQYSTAQDYVAHVSFIAGIMAMEGDRAGAAAYMTKTFSRLITSSLPGHSQPGDLIDLLHGMNNDAHRYEITGIETLVDDLMQQDIARFGGHQHSYTYLHAQIIRMWFYIHQGWRDQAFRLRDEMGNWARNLPDTKFWADREHPDKGVVLYRMIQFWPEVGIATHEEIRDWLEGFDITHPEAVKIFAQDFGFRPPAQR